MNKRVVVDTDIYTCAVFFFVFVGALLRLLAY